MSIYRKFQHIYQFMVFKATMFQVIVVACDWNVPTPTVANVSVNFVFTIIKMFILARIEENKYDKSIRHTMWIVMRSKVLYSFSWNILVQLLLYSSYVFLPPIMSLDLSGPLCSQEGYGITVWTWKMSLIMKLLP